MSQMINAPLLSVTPFFPLLFIPTIYKNYNVNSSLTYSADYNFLLIPKLNFLAWSNYSLHTDTTSNVPRGTQLNLYHRFAYSILSQLEN